MKANRFIAVLLIYLAGAAAASAQEQEAEQQINDFSLAGYGEKGKKTWDIAGKSADIMGDDIQLKNITSNLYGDKEDIKMVADKGDFNKAEGKVHVEQNVVITTSTGAKLTTDSLDWDRKNQTISTQEQVNIEKENMVTTGQGAIGKPDLKKVTLQKDVKVVVNPQDAPKDQSAPAVKDKMVITCDGPLQVDYEKNIATFNENVKVDRGDSQIYSDTMDVYFASEKNAPAAPAQSAASPQLMGSKINQIIARGHVRIVRGENTSYSDEAVYTAASKKITLRGQPKLVIYSSEDMKDMMSGQ